LPGIKKELYFMIVRKQTRPGPTKYTIAEYLGIDASTVKRAIKIAGLKELKSRDGRLIPFSYEEAYLILRTIRQTDGEKITRRAKKSNDRR
jgi:hypothetical protein